MGHRDQWEPVVPPEGLRFRASGSGRHPRNGRKRNEHVVERGRPYKIKKKKVTQTEERRNLESSRIEEPVSETPGGASPPTPRGWKGNPVEGKEIVWTVDTVSGAPSVYPAWCFSPESERYTSDPLHSPPVSSVTSSPSTHLQSPSLTSTHLQSPPLTSSPSTHL